MRYWLMKSEPDVFSIDHLEKKKVSGWDGVRNYQARNFMRDDMKLGDLAFLYHSSCEVPGIAGIMSVVKESHPDPTQFDKKSDYYDPKATKEKPIWFMVELKFVEKLPNLLPLTELKSQKPLKNMLILRPGNRLSITPVTADEWKTILSLK